jgi:uncharacterized protein (DUF488 family)
MIKWIFFSAILTGAVFAQPVTGQKPVECVNTETLFQGLIESNYKENPIWLGIEPGATLSKYSLFVNEQTKTWTLIQFDEKMACVLGTGENSTRIFTGPKT